MKAWNVWAAAAAIAAAAVLCVAWRLDRAFDVTCGNRMAAERASPDARHRAVAFARDCGATGGFSAQVSVLAINEALANEAGNALVVKASGDTPEAVLADVSVEWNGSNELVVRSFGVPVWVAAEVDGVRIVHR